MARQNIDPKKKLLEEKVINLSRVTKVTKGGRHFRFSATVVVGNRKGLVGMGTGKANEVNDAIAKASKTANKNVTRVALQDARTIPHEATGKVGRAVVLIKPAKAINSKLTVQLPPMYDLMPSFNAFSKTSWFTGSKMILVSFSIRSVDAASIQ